MSISNLALAVVPLVVVELVTFEGAIATAPVVLVAVLVISGEFSAHYREPT